MSGYLLTGGGGWELLVPRRVGLDADMNRHRAWTSRGCDGEICLSLCNVLYLSRVCVFVRDSHLSGKFHQDRNHSVCDVLAMFLYRTLNLC